ncbi:MAG: DUF6883 domain-containing protein [Acidobacteriota bacterium]
MIEEERQVHPQALPNYEHAVILRSKLEGYVLNPDHDPGKHKARVFKSALGFDQSNWDILQQRILDELPFHIAELKAEGLFGKQYDVVLPIKGPNQQIVDVITGWIIRPETDFPSLVTALVAKK